MIYEVLKPFNTVNRRLGVGADFDAAAEPIAPFNIEEREENGFIKLKKLDEEPAPVAAPAAPTKRQTAQAAEPPAPDTN